MQRKKQRGGNNRRKEIEAARENLIYDICEGSHEDCVSMRMLPRAGGYGFLDDAWDDDGDSIIVRHESRFVSEGHPAVTCEFARGTSPQMAARVLRKFAEMLEGLQGYQIVNLGNGDDDYADGRRLPDGEVLLGNIRVELRDYLNSKESLSDGDVE